MSDLRRKRPARKFYRKVNQVGPPYDQATIVDTPPRYLVFADGLYRDGRRSAGSVDEPGYVGDLSDPDLDT